MGFADWATKKTIKVQLGRLNQAYTLGKHEGPGAKLAQAKIIGSVMDALTDIFISDNHILRQELQKFFDSNDAADVYEKIKIASSNKYGDYKVNVAEMTSKK